MVIAKDAAPVFHVGRIPVYGDTVLSPMDGYSDLPFRSLARRLGSAMSYTEFISAKLALQDKPEMQRRLTYHEWERPVVFQIYGSEPERMLRAALHLRKFNPDIIDVNLGCWTRAVVGHGAGAGLLRQPDKITEIFSRLSAELDIPLTGKIRLGWDDDSLNYLEVAQIIEDNGGKAVAVHARTRQQGYSGRADWDAIAEIKGAVSIPVIGNGDVKTVADIAQMKAHTGCDAVMIARAAIGNPWLFAGLDRLQVEPEQVRETMLAHLESMLDFYGPQRGLVLFRKHAKQYISPYPLANHQRRQLLTCETPADFVALLDSILEIKQVA
ncbi:tRNA dihydrouridine synthase DusB [Chloroflexota bacterium]